MAKVVAMRFDACHLALVAGIVTALAAAGADAAECVAGVEPIDDDLAYRDYDDRCEGLFAKPVSAAGLTILGFHRHPPRFQEDGSALSVQVRGAGTVRLRALSMRHRHYYRMDATVGVEGSFTWKREIISQPSIQLRDDELAVIACKPSCEAAEPERHIYPVSVTDSTAKIATPEAPVLVLTAEVDLEELRVVVFDPDDGRIIIEREELGGYLPAGAPVEVLLDELPRGQTYRFEALAVPRQGVGLDRVGAMLVLP